MAQVVTVFGATGTQGGGVADLLLKTGGYTVRAVTRDTKSSAALALQSKGAVLVKADLGNAEEVRDVVKGADFVFAITNPTIATGDPTQEIEQGKAIADAVKAANVKLLIWSSFKSAKEISGHESKYPAADNKALITKYIKEKEIPYVVLNTAFFAENLFKFGFFGKSDDGGWEMAVPRIDPEKRHPVIWVRQTLSDAVLTVIRNYPETVNKTFGVSTAFLTGNEWADILSKATGKKVTYKRLETANFGPVLSPIINHIYDFISTYGDKYGYTGPEPELLKLGHQPGTLEEFGKTDILEFIEKSSN